MYSNFVYYVMFFVVAYLTPFLRLALHDQVSCASFLRKVLRELLHGELFFCLKFLQKEMSAIFAQETC